MCPHIQSCPLPQPASDQSAQDQVTDSSRTGYPYPSDVHSGSCEGSSTIDYLRSTSRISKVSMMSPS